MRREDLWMAALMIRARQLVIAATGFTSLFLCGSSPTAGRMTVPGSTAAQFAVNPDGGATYSIPLKVPPGTAGMEPKLALTYSSRAGVGAVGYYGWTIAGLSSIQRGPRSLSDDGMVGGVEFTASDALYMDGERLIEVARAPDGLWHEFRSRIDSFARIRAYEWSAVGPARFIVETRAGLRMFYGSTGSSQVRTSGGPTMVWLCDRIEDRSGNYILFSYDIDGPHYRIHDVRYTGNLRASVVPYSRLVFDYRTVDPMELRFAAGERLAPTSLLTGIRSLYKGRVLRRYDLVHRPIDGQRKSFLLAEVHERGHDGLSFPPLRFTYGSSTPGWQEQVPLSLPDELSFVQSTDTRAGFRLLDVNGDGRDDVVYRTKLAADTRAAAFVHNGVRWERRNQWTPPVDLAVGASPVRSVVTFDADGDGTSDLVASGSADEDGIYLAKPDGWERHPPSLRFRFTVDGTADDAYLLLDVDPGAHNGREILWSSRRQGRGFAHFDGRRWRESAALAPPRPFSLGGSRRRDGVLALDVDCNGVEELVYHRRLDDGTLDSEILRYAPTGWVAVTDPRFALPFPPPPSVDALRVADLDADGCNDIAVAFEAAGGATRQAFLARGTGWQADTRPLPPVSFWRDGAITSVRLTDFDGDGRADLAGGGRSSTQDRAAYRGTAAEWIERETLVPPAPLQPQGDPLAAGGRVAQLDGGRRREIVYFEGPEALGSVYSLTLSGEWVSSDIYKLPLHIAQFDKIDLGVRFPDLDGDGLADLAFTRRSGGQLSRYAYLYRPWDQVRRWQETPQFKIPIATFSDDFKDTGVAIADFSGDGLADVLSSYRAASGELRQALYLNCSKTAECRDQTGEGAFWKQVPVVGLADEPFTDERLGPVGARFTDVNGDGLIDILASRALPGAPSSLRARAYLNQLGSFRAVPGLAPPVEFVRPLLPEEGEGLGSTMRDNRVEVLDLNGDRLPDLVYHFKSWRPVEPGVPGAASVAGAYLNRGDRWEAAPAYAPPHRIDTDDTRPNRQIYLEDVNGDALPDLLYVERGSSETFLNTGAGWTPAASYVVPDAAVTTVPGDQGFRFLDVNGDGLVDLTYSYAFASDPSHPRHGTYLNSGLGWVAGPGGFDLPLALTEEQRGDLGVRPLDLNGDGLVDLVKAFQQEDGTTRHTTFVNVSGKPDLLLSLVNGLGMATRIEHRSLLGVDLSGRQDGFPNYDGERSSTYPVIDAPVPGYVVCETRAAAPGVPVRTSRYRYAGYRIDSRNGRTLGFSRQSVQDVERRRTTRIDYLQDDGLVGSTVGTDVMQGKRRISRSGFRWKVTRVDGLRLPNGFLPSVLRPTLEESSLQSWDLAGVATGSQTDTFKYDAMGNPVRILTRFGDGSGSQTRNTYGDDASRWLLGRLTSAEVTLFAPGLPSQTRTARFAYDQETGLLLRETSLSGSPLELEVTYRRDRFGNKSQTCARATATGEVRCQTTLFDPQGRFAIATENALGHREETAYDEVAGVVIEHKDANGATTSATFDSLGRPLSETGRDGVTTRLRSFHLDASEAPLHYATGRRLAGLPEALTFYDSAGRVREERSIGFAGKIVVSRTEYDALGTPRRTSLPHFAGDPEHWIERQLDALDRPVRESRPDGSTKTWTYVGLETVVENSNRQRLTSRRDLRGRLTETTDALEGRTTFSYDTGGNRVAVTNALGQSMQIEFDLAGNKIRSIDPSAGTWTYRYNAFAELVEQTDPRGNTTRIEYDRLGRTVRRTTAADEQVWIYDRLPLGIGMLAESALSNGSRKAYKYDAAGRRQRTSVRHLDDEVVAEQLYDQLGRPSVRRYSTGVELRNEYDSHGFWTRVLVKHGGEESVTWEALDFDALGRPVDERLGSGLLTTRRYRPESGRLESIRTTSGRGTVLQDLQLEHDLVGNVVARTDAAARGRETFEYDALNRLSRSRAGDGSEVAVTYDALGNILAKSDVGSYAYCDPGDGSHRLCSTTDGDGQVSRLAYDQTGNVTLLGDRAISYTPDGRAQEIRRSSLHYASFAYGVDGEIVRHTSRDREIKFKAVFLEDVEILREEFAPPLFPTAERTRVRNYIATPSGAVGFYEKTYLHFPMRQASPAYGDQIVDKPERTTAVATGLTLFLRDNLGSIQATVGTAGNLLERFSYDPWGARRKEGRGGRYSGVRSGFTGHEQVDALALVHMGGRVYDPLRSRFLSADPFVQAPAYSQSHNRYAYVLNNPLGMVDPSGFWGLGDLVEGIGNAFRAVGNAVGQIFDAAVGKPLRWISEQLNKAGRWLSENWRTVAVIAASVVLSVAVPGLGAVAAGALIGGLQAALYGGSIHDVMKGAIVGAISGALFSAAGEIGVRSLGNDYLGTSAVHGVVGGVTAELNGGEFATGFATAFLTKAAAPGIEYLPNAESRVAAAAVVGGTVASIGGDSFENGALTGAFSRAFNDEAVHGLFSYEGDPVLEYSLSGDLSLSSSLGGPTYSTTTGALGTDIPLGPYLYVGGDTQGNYQFGVTYSPLHVVENWTFKYADARAFVSYSTKSQAVGAGVSVRALPFNVQGSATVRPGSGLYRAVGDFERGFIRAICAQGGGCCTWWPRY